MGYHTGIRAFRVRQMTTTESTSKPSYNWPELTAVLFSIIAIVISGYSLLEGRWQHRDERNTEILDAVYENWEMLALQNDWRVQHLLEAPQTYSSIRDLIRRATAGLDDVEKAKTLLVERSMANLVFTNFEHHLKQWLLAVELEDESRQRVLREEIDFYAQVQLRNPRLLWFWSEEGGGWVHGADPSSVEWYEKNVLNDPGHPLEQAPDAEGVLPGFDWRTGPGN
jgi:hypothetical protein